MNRSTLAGMAAMCAAGCRRSGATRRGMHRQVRLRLRLAPLATVPTAKGLAPNPPLAGKSEAQLVQALEGLPKSGKRDNAVMKGMASSPERRGYGEPRGVLRVAEMKTFVSRLVPTSKVTD